jgi:hypothetical protein
MVAAMGKPAIYPSYQPIEPKTELLLSLLSGVKNTGRDKWLALCPAHDDRSPSLGIKQLDDKIIFIVLPDVITSGFLTPLSLMPVPCSLTKSQILTKNRNPRRVSIKVSCSI